MQYSVISFPSLGIEWDPARSISIGPLNIYLYGLIIATRLLLAVFYGCRRSRQFGINEDTLTDGVLWVTPFAFLCARLYYCIFYWEEGGYADNLLSVLYVWQGGLAIYGGVIGAIVGIIVFCKVKKISIGAVLDIVALGFLIGQTMGRWGNFFNREAFGAETDSFLRMGLYNTYTGMTEAWYGLGRVFIEGLRTDSLYIGAFRVSQLVAGISFVLAAAMLICQALQPHDPQKLFVNRVAENTKEDQRAAE